MTTTFDCPGCGRAISTEASAGESVLCPFCQQVVTVPAAAGPPLAGAGEVPYAAMPQQPKRMGLAIAALVCGIVGLAACFPLAAVGLILGIVALVKANREPSEYGGKGLAIAGICTGGLGIVVLPATIGMLMAILMPSLSQAREQSRRVQCASNLCALAQGMNLYAERNDGAFPPDFQALIESVPLRHKLFHCPSLGAKVGDLDACYVLIAGQRTSDEPTNVLVYERSDCHGRAGGNVLFVDGHVEFVEPYSRVEELVEQTRQRLAERGR